MKKNLETQDFLTNFGRSRQPTNNPENNHEENKIYQGIPVYEPKIHEVFHRLGVNREPSVILWTPADRLTQHQQNDLLNQNNQRHPMITNPQETAAKTIHNMYQQSPRHPQYGGLRKSSGSDNQQF